MSVAEAAGPSVDRAPTESAESDSQTWLNGISTILQVATTNTCGEGGLLEFGIVLESGELESWNEVEWYGIEMEWQNLLELL